MVGHKRSKTGERSLARMLADLESQEIAFERYKRTRDLAPPGWRPVESRARIEPRKTTPTVTLDAGMVAWFRGLGRGYQPRMNAVLRAYRHGVVISEEIEQKGGLDWKGDVI